ncbi:geraniol 8-hydroxylase [Quercus suber]|uniref:Geraniol 8-hydroxylase n=1 Tax=Quercus suber TaxID=58331 RepID=A0AAW0LZR6_QUESU
MAKEVLQKNDQAFSSRTIPNMAHVFDHHKVSIGWIPVNSQWRNLRKACATQIFAPQLLFLDSIFCPSNEDAKTTDS